MFLVKTLSNVNTTLYFSQKEVKHITIAALLVIGIGFSIGLYGNFFGGFLFEWTWAMMAIFAAIMTVSFLTHEIAHKIIAQKKGLWAEFRLTTWGAVLTFASIFLPFRMIAPGAMMIGGSIPKGEDLVKISIAGPITNLIFSSALLGCAFSSLAKCIFRIAVFCGIYQRFHGSLQPFTSRNFGWLTRFSVLTRNFGLWLSSQAFYWLLLLFLLI